MARRKKSVVGALVGLALLPVAVPLQMATKKRPGRKGMFSPGRTGRRGKITKGLLP